MTPDRTRSAVPARTALTSMRCRSLIMFLAALACTSAAELRAQTYPTRPIRLIATQPPGAGTDTTARLIAPRLGAALGEQLIVDNRGGASGNIATELVARASPDGYTLLITTPAHAINPTFNPNL